MVAKVVPWREAITTILKSAGGAMHYTEIAEQIAEQGLRRSLGATPANTVYSNILDANAKAPSPVFVKTGKGEFMLAPDDAVSQPPAAPQKAAAESAGSPIEASPVVRSVGMYWQTSRVKWKTSPRLLGRQQAGSAVIDFAEQKGLYILYDRHRPIYVGRSVERPLGIRLAEHMRDRLNGRWDRFSWFGLRAVDDAGKLGGMEFAASPPQTIALMEALLIEALEPPLNRKRGDDFSGIEFLQVEDPELASDQKKQMLELLKQKLEL